MEGLDPDQLRAFASAADAFAGTAGEAATSARSLIAACDLASGVDQLCDEVVEEVSLLHDIGQAKATAMEMAGSGISFAATAVGGLLDRLIASLDDGIGVDGLVGDNALASLTAGFALVDADGDGALTPSELEDAAHDSTLPVDLQLAAAYLVDNPGLFEHAWAVSIVDHRFDEDAGFVAPGGVTEAGLAALLRQNGILRTLSDRDVFAEIESANNGELDGDLSRDDLEAIMASDGASSEARSVAEALLNDEAAWAWFRSGADAGFDVLDALVFLPGTTMSFDNVVALTVNQHAFASEPAGARTFALSLADSATWTEVSGKQSGIDIRLSSDDGLRALASAALSDAPSLTEQVTVVSSLPESRGGVRNQLITYYYAQLAGGMNERLNVGLDPGDPMAVGHTGANWMQYAPWASNSVGPAITADISAYGFKPSWSDRQYAADGNQYIFGDVAIRYAVFLDTFPAGDPITADRIESFFGGTHPVEVRRQEAPLFGDGHGQLRDSFAYYLAAIEEGDQELRQRNTMLGNILIATHEQAGAQHALAGIVDLDVGDDGWFRGTVGEVGSWFAEGSDEKVATNRMRLDVGFDNEPIFVGEDLRETSFPDGNRVLDEDLATTLNPDGRSGVAVGDVRIGFDGGSGDVSLEPIGGWGDPPPGSDMDSFPTDVAEWEAEAGFELSASDRELMEHTGRDPDDLPSTFGTDATNWADPHQRQWFISNMFQQMHGDPVLFDGLDDLTRDSEWGSRLDYLPDTVSESSR